MLGLRRDFGTAIADPQKRDENSKKNGGLLVEIFGRFTFRPLLMLNWVNPMKQNQHIFLTNCNKFFFLGQFVAAFWLFLAVFFHFLAMLLLLAKMTETAKGRHRFDRNVEMNKRSNFGGNLLPG